MKMRKIVAIVAAVLMLFSVIPFSAMAADTTVVFQLGDDGSATHKDGSSAKTTYSETVDGYTLDITGGTKMYPASIDAKGNGCIKLGTSSAVGGFSFTVPADVTSVIIAIGKYKANTTKLTVNGTAYTLTKNSNDGAYDEITVDTTSNKTITLTTVSGGVRAMVNSITYVIPAAGGTDCDHNALECGELCPDCGEYTKEHKYSNNCVAECENGCGTANPNYADHVYSGIYDAECDVCFAKREVNFPEADSVLTIPAATALGLGLEHNTYTPGKYYVTGEVVSVDNAEYGNLTITDGENTFIIYGSYNEDGTVSFKNMTEKPEAGMTVTIYGNVGQYGGKAQIKNGWITEMIGGCEHEYEFECSTTCQLCGKGEREAACVTDAQFACADGLCIYCGNDVNALEHDFDDDWDPDCNYGCGYTREVEEKPAITEATLDFSTLDQRTEYSTTVQVWENGSLVLTNNKGGSTSNVGNYSNPARFYKGSEIIIAYPGMTQLVINGPTGQYGDPWAATLEAAGLTYTVDGGVYTVTFAAPVDSITLTTTAQVRANSMTATAVKTGDDACNHVWVDATCTAPKTCSICGAIEGTVLDHDWEIISQVDATCTADGSTTYECAACGEDKVETTPAIPHNYVDGICSACGAELSQKVDKIDDVANLTAGTYYLAGYSVGYNGTTVEDWSSYPWHVWTGDVYSGDLVTTPYYYSENNGGFGIASTDPTVSGTLIELQAVEGKANTYYIVCNAKYLASTENATSRRLALVTEPTEAVPIEWVATANEKGGITLSSNGVYLGTGDAASRLVRAYKAESTLQYGVVLFSFDNEAPACEHEYDNACDVDCNLCGETREVTHNVVHVEAKASTCTTDGNIEYWFCDVCGAAWLDEACTLNTNLKAVVLPMAEHTYDDEYDADCNECGEIRDVPEKPDDEILYGDADGDGEITLLDAGVLSQYLGGYEVDIDLVAADADGDGEVTLLDAGVLSQYLGGYDVTLGPAEGPAEDAPLFNDGELGGW